MYSVSLGDAPCGGPIIFNNLNASAVNAAYPGLIVSNTISNTYIVVQNVFNVDMNLTFNHCEIVCLTGAKINVLSGNVLNVQNLSLIRGCTNLWEGIEVGVGGFSANTKLQVTNSTVSDAVTGAYTLNGSKIEINASFFDKNHVHLSISNISGTYGGFIRASGFTCSSNLLSNTLNASITFRCIEVNNGGSIKIGNHTVASDKNTFQNFDEAAVRVFQAALTIENFEITNPVERGRGILVLGSSTATQNVFIHHPSGFNLIRNCKRPIHVAGNYSSVIQNNHIEEYATAGIFVTANRNQVTVRNNNLSNLHGVGAQGIYVIGNPFASLKVNENRVVFNSISGARMVVANYTLIDGAHRTYLINRNYCEDGVLIMSVSNLFKPQLHTNEVYFKASNSLPLSPPVNGLWSTGNFKPDIQANIAERLGGVITNYDGIKVNLCIEPYICNNQATNFNQGITCTGTMLGTKFKNNTMSNCEYGFTLPIFPSTIGHQGNLNSNEVSDNLWINNVTDGYCAPASNPIGLPNTEFFVRNNPNYYATNFVTFSTPLFQCTPVASANPPYANCQNVNGWRFESSEMDAALQVFLSQTGWEEKHYWLTKKLLYEQVNLLYAQYASSAVNDFISGLENTAIGKIYTIDRLITAAHSDTVNYMLDTAALADAFAIAQSIDPHSDIEELYKSFYEIYLQTAALGIETFTAEQQDNLLYIAQLCPVDYGMVVHNARHLYFLIDSEMEFTDAGCASSGLRKADFATSTTPLTFYPNPASTNITVQAADTDEKQALTLYSIEGRKVLKHTLQSNNENLNISFLAPGVYYAVVSSAQKTTTTRLVITRP